MLSCTCDVCLVVHVHRDRCRWQEQDRGFIITIIIIIINHVLSRCITRPVPVVVVQVVLVDDDDDGGGGGSGALLLHGRGARHSRFRFSGRPGSRTLSTYVVAGATITTTPGPHRGDRRDRQLRQDGGRWRFFATKPCIVLCAYTGCSRSLLRLPLFSRFDVT